MKQLHIPSFYFASPLFLNPAAIAMIAKTTSPIRINKSEVDTTMTPNMVTRIIGEDSLAILNINNLHPADEMTRKALTRETQEALHEAETNLFLRGFISGEQEYEFLAATPSQKKQGKATFVKKGLRAKLFEELGLSDELFDKASYIKGEDKIIPNMLSGQSEGSIAKAKLGMQNIFLLKSRAKGTFYKHSIHADKVVNLDVMGNILSNIHEDTLTNKTGDANGMVIREMLPEYKQAFIEIAADIDHEARDAMRWEGSLAAIKVANKNGTLNKINALIYKKAERGEADLFWTEQSRGKGLKATITDAPVFKWAIELGIEAIDGFFGETKTWEEIEEENLAILMPEDAMKASALWSESKGAWIDWVEKGYETIWVCDNGHVGMQTKEKNRVMTSRQHLCPIVGAEEETVNNMAAYSADEIRKIEKEGTEEAKLAKKLFGDEFMNSFLAKAMTTESMISKRNLAEQGKISVPGTWAMVIWDLKPMLAVAAHLENEEERAELIKKARTLGGQTAALNAQKEQKVAALGRYPSLNKNLMLVRLVGNTEICANTIMLSWDIAANDVMKADTDGDHLVCYFAESDEEKEDAMLAIEKIERN